MKEVDENCSPASRSRSSGGGGVSGNRLRSPTNNNNPSLGRSPGRKSPRGAKGIGGGMVDPRNASPSARGGGGGGGVGSPTKNGGMTIDCGNGNGTTATATKKAPSAMDVFAQGLPHLETTSPKSPIPQNKFTEMPHMLSPVHLTKLANHHEGHHGGTHHSNSGNHSGVSPKDRQHHQQHHDGADPQPEGGCMGLSFDLLWQRATNKKSNSKGRSSPSPRRRSSSPQSRGDIRGIINIGGGGGATPATNSDVMLDSFQQMRTNVQQRVKTLNPLWQCSASSVHSHGDGRSPDSRGGGIMSFSDSGTFDYDDLDHHRGLLQRIISWSSVGTSYTMDDQSQSQSQSYTNTNTHSHSHSHSHRTTIISPARQALEAKLAQPGGGHTMGMANQNPKKKSATPKKVHFQYPPITSLRLRPRTQEEEIGKLFFVEDELDQIEDDRIGTEATDDVETLVVEGHNPDDWQMLPPACTSSSTISASMDEGDYNSPRNASRLASPMSIRGDASNKFLTGARPRSSPPNAKASSSAANRNPKSSKRIVQGVQILLREKSV